MTHFSQLAGRLLNAPYWVQEYDGNDVKECIRFHHDRQEEKQLLTTACERVENEGGNIDDLPSLARSVWDKAAASFGDDEDQTTNANPEGRNDNAKNQPRDERGRFMHTVAITEHEKSTLGWDDPVVLEGIAQDSPETRAMIRKVKRREPLTEEELLLFHDEVHRLASGDTDPALSKAAKGLQRKAQKAVEKAGITHRLTENSNPEGHNQYTNNPKVGDGKGIKDRLRKLYKMLPAWVRKPIGLFVKLLYTPYVLGNKAVQAVAKERGLNDKQVNKLAVTVAAGDWVGGKVAQAATAAGFTPAAALAFVPWASVGYLAVSTAKHPLATLRAARKTVKEYAKRFKRMYRDRNSSTIRNPPREKVDNEGWDILDLGDVS